MAQTPEAVYFPQTGHWVSGEFLTKYRSAVEPERVYGLPITDAFFDHRTNRVVQYFTKAHFVLEPQAPEALRVQLTPLGKLLYTPEANPSLAVNSTDCRFFGETGFKVCYAFLDFFEAYGDVSQFGFPISNFENVNGRITQCFQRACLEWHPELPPGDRVAVVNLGVEYFKKNREDPRLLGPNNALNAPRTILSIQADAFVAKAVTSQREWQVLYVIVRDQNLRALASAQVQCEYKLPDGETKTFSLPPTNQNGISYIRFPIDTHAHGVFEMVIDAWYDTFYDQTRSSFRIWW